jgi:glutaredoxin
MKKSLFLYIAVVCAASAGASAQTIYRIVGADGKVTFSDKPPASLDQGKVIGTGVGATGSATGASLPFELKQVVSKYPVTLYTAPKCAPCDAGRSLLAARGVPFNERTVTTAEDGDYLQRLTGENSLPVVSIGGQRLRGFSDGEWSQYLDAAGYPKTSILPAAYRNVPPEPLVAVQKAPAPKAEEAARPQAADASTPPREPNPPNPANPAGIKF